MTLNELYRTAKTALEPVTEDRRLKPRAFWSISAARTAQSYCCTAISRRSLKRSKRCFPRSKKRKTGEPLQYLLGEWDFMSLTLSAERAC